MKTTTRGHSVVEFAVLFPLFLLVVLVLSDVVRLGFLCFDLERDAFSLARVLAASPLDLPELEGAARARLDRAGRVDTEASVSTRSLGSQRGSRPGEGPLEVEVLDLTLRRSVPVLAGLAGRVGFSTVPLVARAREPRFRESERTR